MAILRIWYAIDVSLRNSPPVAAFRQECGPLSDAYVGRAYEFCKLYSQTGDLKDFWQALAGFIDWPTTWTELRDIWRRLGIVTGGEDELYQWMGTNGWMLAKREAERKRSDKNRRAARIGARKRRLERAAKQKAKRTKNGGWVGR
jgi:hypothetical protein